MSSTSALSEVNRFTNSAVTDPIVDRGGGFFECCTFIDIKERSLKCLMESMKRFVHTEKGVTYTIVVPAVRGDSR